MLRLILELLGETRSDVGRGARLGELVLMLLLEETLLVELWGELLVLSEGGLHLVCECRVLIQLLLIRELKALLHALSLLLLCKPVGGRLYWECGTLLAGDIWSNLLSRLRLLLPNLLTLYLQRLLLRLSLLLLLTLLLLRLLLLCLLYLLLLMQLLHVQLLLELLELLLELVGREIGESLLDMRRHVGKRRHDLLLRHLGRLWPYLILLKVLRGLLRLQVGLVGEDDMVLHLLRLLLPLLDIDISSSWR